MATYTLDKSLTSRFTESELEVFVNSFEKYDPSHTGSISLRDLYTTIMESIPDLEEYEDIEDALIGLDMNSRDAYSINDVMSYVKSKLRGLSFGSRRGSLTTYKTRKTEDQSFHSVEDRERIAFINHINNSLKGDRDLNYLPIDPETDELFTHISNGILLCKMINKAAPNTIDERAINKHENMNVFQKTENLRLALNAASSIGCVIINIGWNDLLEATPHLVLGLIWQIIKVELLSGINISMNPNLAQVFDDAEGIDWNKIPPQEILLKWFNYHLNRVGCPRRVTNFGKDIQDSECYSNLLYSLDGNPHHLDCLQSTDPLQRAQSVIEGATSLGVEPFLHEQDIASGNEKLNLAFVAMIFKACTGLEEVDPKKLQEMLVDVFDTNSSENREERVYRMWINSLGIEDCQLNNIFSDFDDGIKLCKVMDHLQKGVINWNFVNKNPKLRIHKIQNCNLCVQAAKDMNLKIINIGGIDIADKRKMLVLAIVWQLRRYHLMSLLSELGGGKRIQDDDILNWANEMVIQYNPSSMKISSFSDKLLNNGIYLLVLIDAIQNGVVNWDYVKENPEAGETMDQVLESNARYSISLARKLGATVFLTWEDIVEVKPKMILAFVASLMYTYHSIHRN